MIALRKIKTPLGLFYLGANSNSICYASWDSREASPMVGEFYRTMKPHFSPSLSDSDSLVSVNQTSANQILNQAEAELKLYFKGKLKKFSLPCEQKGTLFQKKVWKVIADIPFGSLLSYQEVAALAGSPLAYRAVGTTCGLNKISVIVPCHRVVGANHNLNNLGGYTGGIEKKKWMLSLEGQPK